MGVGDPSHPQELLGAALALWEAEPQTNGNLRRATSTAYYALFHFLIEEACGFWSIAEQRARLARMFEHRTMAAASSRRMAEFKGAPANSVEAVVCSVATTFRRMQDFRHSADYDLTAVVSARDVRLWITKVGQAFADWAQIRNEPVAHDYLFSLLFRDKDRP